MRKTNVVVIDAVGRDQGKHFLITEMACSKAERWANRVAFMFLSSLRGQEEPVSAGMASLAGMELSVGAFAGLGAKWPEVAGLLDEMFDCVQFIPNPQTPSVGLHKPLEEEIEEVQTRWTLRLEVLALHLNFSSADVRSKLAAILTTPGSSTAPTSPSS